MKFGVLGTGMVGRTLATKLVELGHGVMMGARSKDNEKAAEWAGSVTGNAQTGDFSQAAAFGDVVIMAVSGGVALDVARLAGLGALKGKILIDVSNPLDFSRGFPPFLIPELSNTTSVGEELQKLLPATQVVKAFNTMNCAVMTDPARVPGDHDFFLCGEDAGAKAKVTDLVRSFGWTNIVDLGPISSARGMEGLMPFWLSMMKTLGTTDFNYRIARA